MISDSSYWKDTLRKHAHMLAAKLDQRIWRETSLLKVEQSVMISCYIARKLAEAKKITDARFHTPIKMRAFQATGETADLLNKHKLESLYQIAAGVEVTKPLSYIANQLIHSFVFVPIFESPGKFYGFAFNSDFTKVRELYLLRLQPFVEALAACADSYISKATYFRVKDGQLDVVLEEDDL